MSKLILSENYIEGIPFKNSLNDFNEYTLSTFPLSMYPHLIECILIQKLHQKFAYFSLNVTFKNQRSTRIIEAVQKE